MSTCSEDEAAELPAARVEAAAGTAAGTVAGTAAPSAAGHSVGTAAGGSAVVVALARDGSTAASLLPATASNGGRGTIDAGGLVPS